MMRSVTLYAFAALFVITWAGVSQGVPVESTGEAKEGDEDDSVIDVGAKISVKDLVKNYEKLAQNPDLVPSEINSELPTVAEVENALETGEKFDPESAICTLTKDPEPEQKADKPWYSFFNDLLCKPVILGGEPKKST